jgi:hypothetical protein
LESWRKQRAAGHDRCLIAAKVVHNAQRRVENLLMSPKQRAPTRERRYHSSLEQFKDVE